MSSSVFFPDDDLVWLRGQLIADHGNNIVEVKVQDDTTPNDTGSRKINLSKYGMASLPLQNADVPQQGVDDMTKLNSVHEASILDNLRR